MIQEQRLYVGGWIRLYELLEYFQETNFNSTLEPRNNRTYWGAGGSPYSAYPYGSWSWLQLE
jgi:hypothetical protein